MKRSRLVAVVAASSALLVIAGCEKAPQKQQQPPVQLSDVSPVSEPQAADSAKNPDYSDIGLMDLKLDRKKLTGKKIRTHGSFMALGNDELGMLSDGVGDTSPLYVSTSGLSREERKIILECAVSMCDLEIEGRVGTVMMSAGIKADHVRTL